MSTKGGIIFGTFSYLSCINWFWILPLDSFMKWITVWWWCEFHCLFLWPFCKVMVSAKEELNLALSPAMDALLRVHKRIIDVDTNSACATSGAVGTIITRVLVADTQAGSLIGKQGSTIKLIQDASNCTIRVLSAGILEKYFFPYKNV